MSAVVEKATDAAATAVDAITNTLASTSITDKDPKDLKDSQDPNDSKDTATDAAVLASAAERRRLYIGNLAYATDEGELKEFFKGYLVETVFIPKNPRTERPVGYAFVDLSTPTEAERAIAELSGKEILERKVSVQLARTPEPEKKDVASNGENGENGTHRRQSTRGRGRPGRGRGGRARGGRGGSDENHIEGAVHGDDSQDAANGEVHALKDITNEKANENGDKGGKAPRPPRERRERGPPADGIPSKTKVMVANLPYDLSEERLKELFETYSPLSAKIALRPIPRFMIKKLQARGERRKGRGFGFVTLESEELQLQAVAEMNGKEIEGREIAVKVAIDSPDKTDDDITAPIEIKDDTPTATEEPAAPVEAAA